MKWVLIEKNKFDKSIGASTKSQHVKKQIKAKKIAKEKKLEQVKKEVLVEVKKIKAIKSKVAQQQLKIKAAYNFKINDRVRLIDGKSVGTIEKLEKGTASINYGKFTTRAKTSQLELVEAAKH